jgi:hypothetical protein
MSDRFADGTRCIVPVLQPKGDGWAEIPGAHRFTFGFPARSFLHKDGLFAISAVEVASDKDGIDRGFEYHISISRQLSAGPVRCSSNDARWVLDQFGLEGAEEDNHVPYGKVRNFWRAVATPLIGIECVCKEEEPAIREDKGDFVWRP